MAAAAATMASATAFTTTQTPKAWAVRHIGRLNSFAGLKAHYCIASLGISASAEQSFANVMSSLRSSNGKAGKGGGSGLHLQ